MDVLLPRLAKWPIELRAILRHNHCSPSSLFTPVTIHVVGNSMSPLLPGCRGLLYFHGRMEEEIS
jgi:hypothetical protein